MKVWISKGALTGGVFQANAQADKNPFFAGWISVGTGMNRKVFKMGSGAHKTREEAIAAAEKMRVRRIASLRKQIEKLEAMTFGGEE